MLRRLKMALPLLFAFLLTFLPFMLLEYNYSQRLQMQEARASSYWELEAENFIQLFGALWSHEGQLMHALNRYRSFRTDAPCPSPLTGDIFMAELKSLVPERFWPQIMYCGVFSQSSGKMQMLSGKDLRRTKSRFFQMILEPLSSDRVTDNEAEAVDARIRGAFGSTMSYTLLKHHAKRQPTKVIFENSSYFLHWDSMPIDDDKSLVMMGFYDLAPLPLLQTMYEGVKTILSDNENLSMAFIPIETASKDLRSVFIGRAAIDNQHRLGGLAGNFAGELMRENNIPFGTVYNKDGLQVIRAFVDYASPYELWMVRDVADATRQKTPFVVFLTRFFFVAGWLLALVKVLISGRPIGMSLRAWLTLIFIIIGILPLVVLHIAGIFHIESAAFRREQEEIKRVIQQLEEADASSDILVNEYRAFFRKATTMPFWVDNLIKWDQESWEVAAVKLKEFAESFGLRVDTVYFYPPDIAQTQGFAKTFYETQAEIRDESGFYPFFGDFVGKAYHKLAPEMMLGPEPETRFFAGELGEVVTSVFLMVRGDVELVDLGLVRRLHYNNFIIADGMIKNWYVIRLDYTDDLENYLKNAIKDLQSGNHLNIYALARIDNSQTEVLLPPPGTAEYGVFWQRDDKFLELAAATGKRLVRSTDDGLMVVYPCRKAGPFILGARIYMPAFKSDAMYQEFILSLVVLLLALPVLIFSRLVAGHLVSPLKEVEAGLDRIGTGDLKVLLRLKRNDELGRLSQAFDSMVRGIRARMNLGRFVSATLDRKVEKDVQADFEEVKKSFGAVLCCDIRSFTALSEDNPTREIVTMLNEHLGEMADCIVTNGGLVEQFVGDAILAVFHGETAAQASKKALVAASRMMQRHQNIQNERGARRKFVYDIGVGIETGSLYSGTIKIDDKNEYIMVGLVRKKAEALESLSRKGKHTRIVVSPQICELTDAALFARIPGEHAFELLGLGSMA